MECLRKWNMLPLLLHQVTYGSLLFIRLFILFLVFSWVLFFWILVDMPRIVEKFKKETLTFKSQNQILCLSLLLLSRTSLAQKPNLSSSQTLSQKQESHQKSPPDLLLPSRLETQFFFITLFKFLKNRPENLSLQMCPGLLLFSESLIARWESFTSSLVATTTAAPFCFRQFSMCNIFSSSVSLDKVTRSCLNPLQLASGHLSHSKVPKIKCLCLALANSGKSGRKRTQLLCQELSSKGMGKDCTWAPKDVGLFSVHCGDEAMAKQFVKAGFGSFPNGQKVESHDCSGCNSLWDL